MEPTWSEQALGLIRETHSDTPPDPEADPDGAEERMGKYLWEHGSGLDVFVAYDVPRPDHEWSPVRADLLEDCVDEERLIALSEGAALTPEEHAEFLRRADEDVDECDGLVANLWRLGAPAGSAETRAAFFVWVGKECGQQSAFYYGAGPFPDPVAAVRYLYDRNPYDEAIIKYGFPEQGALERWLAERDGDADGA